MKTLRWSAAALITLAACAGTRAAPVQASLDQEFRLSAGQMARVDGLAVRFLRVTEDSRCPINARCVRAGSAKVQVELRAPGSAPESPILETPDNPRHASYGAYEVEVTDLQPGLEIGKPAPRYEAVFRVRRR